MVRIELTKGFTAIVDDQDGDLAAYNWFAILHKSSSVVYAARKVIGKKVKLHRIILERKLGHAIPPGMHTDHIDGNGLNNQRENLRLATCSQNKANAKPYNRNGHALRFKGVCYHRRIKKWQAYIGGIGNKINLGYFITEEDAARAYNDAAKERWGEFARLNEV